MFFRKNPFDSHFQDSKPDGEGKYYDVENRFDFPTPRLKSPLILFRQSWIGRFYPKGALQLQHILQAPVMIE